jgi:hypothetical protein
MAPLNFLNSPMPDSSKKGGKIDAIFYLKKDGVFIARLGIVKLKVF